jgi:O-antigen/teichoic acid export membrane protein
MILENEDMKSKNEVDEIKSKTKHGLISLFSRSFFIYLLRAASIILLSHFLEPKDYGVFGILNGWVWAIHLFLPDLSMFTALIQQKAEPSIAQMRNLFGVCLYRSSLIILFFVLAGFWIVDYHNLEKVAYFMLLALSLGIFFDGIKTPFRLSIERKLNFKAIVYIEVSETFFMYTAQILSAWMGAGTWSFVIALAVRSITGFILYYLCERAIYMPIVSIVEIKKLFHYEVMVQLKKILIGVKGLIIPVVLGKLLSKTELGIVMWTIGIGSIPVILAHNYDRVLFPALSKLQSNIKDFRIVASKGVEYSTLGLGFLFGLIACSASPAINIFFPDKWTEAIILLPVCSFALFLAQIRYLASSIMNASGNPKKLLIIEGSAIVLELLLAIPATITGQGIGYLYALIVVEVIMCIFTLRINRIYLQKSSIKRIIGTLVAFIGCYFFIHLVIVKNTLNDYFCLLLVLLVFPFLYGLILVLIDKTVLQDIKKILMKLKIIK